MIHNSEISNRISILKKVSLFAEINEDVLSRIAYLLSPRDLKENEILFNKGENDSTLYFIIKGRVKAHIGDYVYATFGQSQYFGEYSLLDSSPRSTSVTAIESTQLLSLDGQEFHKLIKEHPGINRSLLGGLVLRLRDYNRLEAELTTKNQEIQKQKEELEEQRKELVALNSTKDKFFAIIAHDLKNPFSTVLGLSELLAREFESFEPEKLKVFIHQIYKYSNNTYNLLENLLQWSLLQTGRMQLKKKDEDLSKIILDNIELLKGNANQKGIDINMLCFGEYLSYIDLNMITTVVRNLLSNAIKFTPLNGQIAININCQGDFWSVTVSDNGVGIEREDLGRLFNIDSNPSTIGTSQEKGTGLGLILCKEFVERNGGKISVESEFGKGTTFTFTVPKAETKQSY